MAKEKKEMFKSIIVSCIAVLLLSMNPVLFMYLQNVGDAYLHELVLPLMVYCGFGIACWLVCSIFCKSFYTGAFVSVPFILIFQNFKALESLVTSLLPAIKWWHVLPAAIVVLIHLAWVIRRIVPGDIIRMMVPIIALIAGVMIIMNIIPATPILIDQLSHAAETTNSTGDGETATGEVKAESSGPNIYWFLFDEYSNFDVIKKYFNYDNSSFAEYLERQGFTVSYDSINDSQQTYTIIANYVALNYIADDSMTSAERVDVRLNQNALFPLLKKNGYTLRGIGNTTDYFPMEGGQQIRTSQTMGGETFEELLLNKTIYGCFATEVFSEKIISIRNSEAIYMQPNFYQNKGTFTMWYEDLPHQPFVFNADGSESNITTWHDWTNPQAYLGSYIHATNILTNLVNTIIKNDPESIIVLQSDHSARSLQDGDGNYLIDKFDRRHCLNAVYYMGEDISEIKGQSGVNTWRLILNRLFDTNYEMLEVPVSEYEF